MRAPAQKPLIVFEETPLLAEIEQWILRDRGVTWRPEFEKRVDEVSVALFGVKRHPKPQQDKFSNRAEFFAAEQAWENWLRAVCPPDYSDDDEENEAIYIAWLLRLGIHIWDSSGDELLCAEWFVEQAVAAVLGIHGARLTLDGSGSAAGQDAEAWGAALERSAKEFRARKR